jgi:hypothetical protein
MTIPGITTFVSGLVLALLAAPRGDAAGQDPSKPPSPLRVVGRRVVNSRDEPVRLRGVNTACLEWTSDGEGHILKTAEVAIRDWHVNHIRLPLSQDRWFGKAPEQKDDGAAYRALVRQVVDRCASRGCYVMLDLHWSDAGEWGKNIGQHVMPDRNSLEFWKSAAVEYRDHPAVLFDLYNEPHDVSWDVWLRGGQVTEKATNRAPARSYEAVGMQAMLDAVRATGAKNVVVAGGLDWSYDMSGFLEGKLLSDPNGNGVIYANHAYPFKGDTVEKWIAKMEAAAAKLPVIVSEFGSEAQMHGGRGEQWVREVLEALEAHQWAWTAWDLHPAAGPRLISDWKYTPTPFFGKWVKQALDGALPKYEPHAAADATTPGVSPQTRSMSLERAVVMGSSGRRNRPSSLPPVPRFRGERFMRMRDFVLGMIAGGLLTVGPVAAPPPDRTEAVGIFEGHGDVGAVKHPGAVGHDANQHRYTVSGSGKNMWFNTDAFHFAWKKASGDVSLAADVAFLGQGTDPHRKSCLMIRQSLDADSAYVDVALHGDGLTSLQFRETAGANTHEVQANVKAPRRLRIEKRGKYALLYVGPEGREPEYSGASASIALTDPFYVGIGVCSHNEDVTEQAVFSRVEIGEPRPASEGRPVLHSTLETQTIASTDRRVVYVTPTRIEAPNWLKDGKSLIFNSRGRIHRIAVEGGTPEPFDTGFATRCNNDHGLSPDGKLLAISDQSQPPGKSIIYTLPIAGGTPKRITPEGPSYWHGWSPDGKTLAFCGERKGEFDIYTIPAEGGPETRLTTAEGLDDGPEYSPDGRHIYFNSVRTGTMQIWRMRTDGTDQEQITSDGFNNWFPHVSPDGRFMTILSYEKEVTGHPENKDVTLRLMDLSTRKITVLARLYGGQGTINVPCWSPDSRRIAFVSYQWVPRP